MQRFVELKEQLMDEIIDVRLDQRKKDMLNDKITDTEEDLEMVIRAWEKDFEAMNPDPQENSDFDSDNDINPIDSISTDGKYFSSTKSQISSENRMKKKPIQLSVIGKPNIGKSTLVNAFLKDYRVVANDMPGTTRDSISIQWQFNGRRIILVDNAGIKPGEGHIKTEVDMLINEMVDKSINFSQVCICMIDSMEAFTGADM